jgi:cytochrome P450/NADPH-cytochrome P450 reductase
MSYLALLLHHHMTHRANYKNKKRDMTVTIPQPKEKFLVGNLLDLNAQTPVQDLMRLAREYGPIFRLSFPGRSQIIVSGFDLVDELCNEKRFDKKVWAPLQNLRPVAGDALFTAHTREPNWHKAHSILLPNFSMKAMQGYMPMMLDIAEQLVGKWDRLNPDDEVDVPGDMTRLTLDTIGLCGFDYRFNSFYREDMNPFVDSMVSAMKEALERLHRLPAYNNLLFLHNRQFQQDIELMNSTVDKIIQERKKSGVDLSEKQDLLNYMLAGIDKESGEGLDDINIRYQIITFLIAGHETTSGLLSFAIYNLLHHPEVLRKAYDEVDRVLGSDLSSQPTLQQVNRLKYVSQILKETLRLWPTAPAFALYPYEETTIGGQYPVTPEDQITVLIPMLHRDQSIWGENVEQFDPERFAPEVEMLRPANAYKPFGNGQRACIGRQFAMQEAMLVLGMLLQRYRFIDHLNYQFKIKETLTLKPEDFKIKIRKRTDAERSSTAAPAISISQPKVERAAEPLPEVPVHHTPLLVLHGSNMGTSEDLANRIANDAEARGFAAQVASLDEYTNKLPTEGALVVVTSSYNGTPPDNAIKFCDWIKASELAQDVLTDVKYTIFGVGNHDWATTYQAIPKLIDGSLERFGAQRIYPRGEGDQSGDFDGAFEEWYQLFWQTFFNEFGIEAQVPEEKMVGKLSLELVSGAQTHPIVSSFGAQPMKVLVNRELHRKEGGQPSERSARHIEVELPVGVSYRTGWHLGVIPRNSATQVSRIVRRFSLDEGAQIVLRKSDRRKTALPVDTPISLIDLLSSYVELQDVATRKQIKLLTEYTQCPPEKMRLQALSGDDEASVALYRAEVLEKRKSLLDLLEEFPTCEMPFPIYLELLPAIRPRYYSISSSPLRDTLRTSLTISVVDAPARSGHGHYQGVCTGYLRDRQPGHTIYAFVQDTRSPFMLPQDASVPLIMVGPGTGIAPFRGFLQERAEQQARGLKIGKSLLFFGCRNPEQDFLYEDELKAYVREGILDLYTAFSRWEGHPKQYVQDVILQECGRVWQALEAGAIIYICGDAARMAPDVKRAFVTLYQQQTNQDATAAEAWLENLIATDRYLVDVWPS